MVRGTLKKGKEYFLMDDRNKNYTPVKLVKWEKNTATVLSGIHFNSRREVKVYMLESFSGDAYDRTMLHEYLDDGNLPGDVKSRRTNMARLKRKFPEYFI